MISRGSQFAVLPEKFVAKGLFCYCSSVVLEVLRFYKLNPHITPNLGIEPAGHIGGRRVLFPLSCHKIRNSLLNFHSFTRELPVNL